MTNDSFVHVDDITMQRTDGKAVVTAHIRWNVDGVNDQNMIVGDLRLVAVSDQGHLPFLLGTINQNIARDQTRDVTFTIANDEALAAMRSGNRIVLTASQHQYAGQRSLTVRTYATVAEVQAFGSPQPRIGSKDCSDVPIVPGAILRYCDLVGVYLDGALVSIHDPKSDEGKLPSKSTRLERADLTGATAVRADLSGASIAGGRLNGMDLRRATLNNLSLAGADAIELIADQATSDKDARDSGANFFNTNLTGASLQNTTFRGVSVSQARLDGAQMRGAVWQSIADGATFRGADLAGADLGSSTFKLVDFENASLTDSSLTDLQLAWTWLCRTALPAGSALDGSRDCRTESEAQRDQIPAPDQASPFVTIDAASVSDAPAGAVGPRTVTARINWDSSAANPSGYAMGSGDLRLIAVNRSTGIPTVLDTQSYNNVSQPTDYAITIDDREKLAAMTPGNRIVLTATQHAPRPRSGNPTGRSYVTVDVLQRGPGLGQVGSLDCSRVALTVDSARALDYCDLTGAMLDNAGLYARSMRKVDLTGASVQNAQLGELFLDGSRLGGVDASGAALTNVWAFDAWAPRFDLSGGSAAGSPLFMRNLDGANFNDTTLSDSPLVAASLRRATFLRATLIHPDLAYTDLFNAQFSRVDASQGHPSLFLANLTQADMTGSTWSLDEGDENPWQWATLCRTDLPNVSYGISGDRDCPR